VSTYDKHRIPLYCNVDKLTTCNKLGLALARAKHRRNIGSDIGVTGGDHTEWAHGVFLWSKPLARLTMGG
jgi:hypothetical protein